MTLDELLNRCKGSQSAVSAPVLKAALEAREKELQAKAVEAVSGLFDSFEAALRRSVDTLRAIRKQEKEQNETVRQLDRAFRYFGEVGNPLPMLKKMGDMNRATNFVRQLNIPLPNADDPAWEVPKDWTPTTAEVENAA